MPAKKAKAAPAAKPVVEEKPVETPVVETPTPTPVMTESVPSPQVEEVSQIKPELVKEEAKIVAPVAEETPNMDGWVAVNDIVTKGEGENKSTPGAVFLLTGLMFGLAIGAGGMWWYNNMMPAKTNTKVVTTTKNSKISSTPVAGKTTPSVTPASGVDRKEVTMMVQNGSGVKGAAAVAAEMLSDLGYQIIGTGNAKGGPFEESQLLIKKSETKIDKLLQTDLADKYKVLKVNQTLEETATYDAVLIVGKK